MKNKELIIGLLAIIIGLFVGYSLGINQDISLDEMPLRENHEEDIINSDGAMIHAMDEMMMDFRGKTGEEYEKAFLKGMIVHHIGAIEMAEELLEQTERPELVNMANDIIKVQSEEVDMMKEWLSDWFNI